MFGYSLSGSYLWCFATKNFLTSANIVINWLIVWLFPECDSFTILGIWLFAATHPLSLYTYFWLTQKWIFVTEVKNKLQEINILLRYWLMVENFGWKALEVGYLDKVFISVNTFWLNLGTTDFKYKHLGQRNLVQ